jgi:general secretion pathway protein C
MDLVNDAHRLLTQWPPQINPPKWLSGFYHQWLPQLVLLLLVILVGQQAAHLTWRLLPLPPVQQTLVTNTMGLEQAPVVQQSPTDLAKGVANLHLFGIAGDKRSAVRQVVDNKAPETNLKLTLHGVFAEDDPEAGAAIVGKAGSTQNYYQVGAEIMGGVKLQAVYQDRVVLSRGGRSEVLKFPKTVKSVANLSGPKVANTPTKTNSLKNFRDQFRNEPLKIFQYVRFVPVRSGKALKGYRVLPQRDRELYNQLGLRPSDLITGVNGVSLSDESEASKLLDQLKDVDQIRLDVLRKGQPQSVNLSLN